MDIIRKYSKTHRLQKQNYATVWKNEIAQWEEPASLKMFYTTLEYVVTTKHINRNCIKKPAKLLLKKIYTNHKKSFHTEKSKNATRLSTEYWKLANKKLHPRISWSIKGNYKSYNPNKTRCSLCLHEKLEIVDDPEEILLNKRPEVISQCRHRSK